MSGNFEKVIAEQGRLIYTSVGDSMYPLIQPRDLLVIVKPKKPPKLYDIPLYRRESGQYVLHRIVGVQDGKYVMRGDNRKEPEFGVKSSQILGVLTEIIRDGETIPVEEAMRRNYMSAAYDLIYLVSCALSGEAPDAERCAAMHLDGVYRMALAHSLCAAAAFALEKTIPLPHEFDQAKKKAIRKQALFDVERGIILRELDKAGIWCLPLKGVVLKEYYPKSAMREMTDNDILFDSDKADEVRAVMERLGYTCDMFGQKNHDIYSKPPTLEFEMHRSLFYSDEMPLYYEYFADQKNRLTDDFRMTDEDFYIYVLAHTQRHFSRGGTGLRVLADIFVFLRAKGGGLDRKYIDAELEKLGLTDFERKIRELAQKTFSAQPLSEDEKKMLTYLIRSGSHGTEDNFDYHMLMKKLGDTSDKSKKKYLRSRFFISGKALEKNYPFVYKHRAMYPLLLVYRPIKGVIKRPKELLGEYKKVKGLKEREF